MMHFLFLIGYQIPSYVVSRSVWSFLDCMMSPISKQYEVEVRRREVRDLRIHCACERQKFSRTVLDLINYCQQNILLDPLIHRVKDNPFSEKKWMCGMF